jgi:hypothetical protein
MPLKPDEPSFAEVARQGRPGLATEIWGMLRENKKWWLIPIIVVGVVFGLLLVLGSTGAAPFIYTLF